MVFSGARKIRGVKICDPASVTVSPYMFLTGKKRKWKSTFKNHEEDRFWKKKLQKSWSEIINISQNFKIVEIKKVDQ